MCSRTLPPPLPAKVKRRRGIPTGDGKSLLYQAAPVIDRLTEDEVHHLNVLRPRGLSVFNFRSLRERCCETKLIKASCFLQRFFRLRKESLFLHACSVTIS